jgi:hypothetical protein
MDEFSQADLEVVGRFLEAMTDVIMTNRRTPHRQPAADQPLAPGPGTADRRRYSHQAQVAITRAPGETGRL